MTVRKSAASWTCCGDASNRTACCCWSNLDPRKGSGRSTTHARYSSRGAHSHSKPARNSAVTWHSPTSSHPVRMTVHVRQPPTPSTGVTFRRQCTGGRRMYSPTTPENTLKKVKNFLTYCLRMETHLGPLVPIKAWNMQRVTQLHSLISGLEQYLPL